MKDRFRPAVFLSSRNPTRNFDYFSSGKEKKIHVENASISLSGKESGLKSDSTLTPVFVQLDYQCTPVEFFVRGIMLPSRVSFFSLIAQLHVLDVFLSVTFSLKIKS